MRSARLSLASTRALPRSNWRTCFSSSAIRFCSDVECFGFGPRFFGFNPSIEPSLACLRHCDRSDEYNPSRRSSAPISLRSVQAFTSSTIRRLYSAV